MPFYTLAIVSISTDIPNFGEITDDKPTTTSLIVAETFGKQHKNVLQSIDNIITTLKSIGSQGLSFQPLEIIRKNGIGREYKQRYYEMDRDAFSILVFGFNGPEASTRQCHIGYTRVRQSNSVNLRWVK
jgi:Rha family phage regulatory protein